MNLEDCQICSFTSKLGNNTFMNTIISNLKSHFKVTQLENDVKIQGKLMN